MDEIEALSNDELLAQINAFDPYDVEFVRRFRALEAQLAKADALVSDFYGYAEDNCPSCGSQAAVVWRPGGAFQKLWQQDKIKDMTGQQIVDHLNAADPKAPKMNSPQVFYNWRRNGFPGFDQPETDE